MKCPTPALGLFFILASSLSICGKEELKTPGAGLLENSLGMKFIPVAATPGVRWSIFETREKEYGVFCSETGSGWRKPEFETGPDHPVVNVTASAAAGFCTWLSLRDSEQGLIKGGQHYRLPTDKEWSLAAGLSSETGNTAAERHLTIRSRWPWGADPRPPQGAGNYPDEAWHRRYPFFRWLRGFDDGYVYSAPAGSFKPDGNGLYDLGGNVSEWVHPENGTAWSRGASWHPVMGVWPLTFLELSYRKNCGAAQNTISDTTGFRVVLAAFDERGEISGFELRRAAAAGDGPEVERILKADSFADMQDGRGYSALHHAAGAGETAIVDRLIRHGANIRLKTDEGYTALDLTLIASKYSTRVIPAARLLIGADRSLDHDVAHDVPMLMIAVQAAPLDLVALLLEKGAFPKEPHRRAMVMAGLGGRRFEEQEQNRLLKLFEAAGGDIRTPTPSGMNALHYACNGPYVHRDMLKWLLSRGLDVNAAGREGMTPLVCALRASMVFDGGEDAGICLIENGARVNTEGVIQRAGDAAGAGSTRLVHRLFDAGLDLAGQKPVRLDHAALASHYGLPSGEGNPFCVTPLSQYAMSGDAALLRKAAAHGASARSADAAQTDIILNSLAVCGRADLLDILQANGADLNVPSSADLLLLAAGGDPDRYFGSSKGEPAPFLSLLSSVVRRLCDRSDHAECAKLILSAGKAPDASRLIFQGKKTGKDASTPARGDEEKEGPSIEGQTPLAAAAWSNRAEVVELLIRAGASVEAKDVSGYTPLSYAAESGAADAARVLLSHGADVNVATREGVTPLIDASFSGSLETVKLLLAKGAKLEARMASPDGGTALGAAVSMGFSDIARRLIEAGARMNIRKNDDPRGTLLHTAVRGLLKRRINATNRHAACALPSMEDHLGILDLIVRKGISPDAPAKSLGTPLCVACHPDFDPDEAAVVITKLITLGAGINTRSPLTPLHCAIRSDPRLIRFLLRQGANPNAVSDHELKATSLHLAASQGTSEAARVLVEHGANPDALDGNLQSPLYLAVQAGRLEMVKTLVAAKASLDLRNDYTQRATCLHLAAGKGNSEIIRILGSAGANPFLTAGHPVRSPQIFGRTPRDIAEANGHGEAAAFLEEFEKKWARGHGGSSPAASGKSTAGKESKPGQTQKPRREKTDK